MLMPPVPGEGSVMKYFTDDPYSRAFEHSSYVLTVNFLCNVPAARAVSLGRDLAGVRSVQAVPSAHPWRDFISRVAWK
jgi:hypothetical protein